MKNVGSVVRIAPNSILISDPDTTRDVLAVGSRFKRGPWFDSLRLDAFTSNVVSERDPKTHQQLRAILAPGVSLSFHSTISMLR
jgi:cytochrome P450